MYAGKANNMQWGCVLAEELLYIQVMHSTLVDINTIKFNWVVNTEGIPKKNWIELSDKG